MSTYSRVLLLNTPWNPVGTVFTESELRTVGDFVLRHNLVLISDEIYEAIVYDGHRHPWIRVRRRQRRHAARSFANGGDVLVKGLQRLREGLAAL